VEKKGFYAREISIFVAGYLCGGIVFVIFVWLLKVGYVIPAWVINTAIIAKLAVLFGASRIMRKFAAIEAEEIAAREVEANALRHRLGKTGEAYDALRSEHRYMRDAWAYAQAESTRAQGELAEKRAEEASLCNASPSTGDQAPVLDTGLTFPYTTKELKAMRDAVSKHWEGYTPEKRQPTQKAVALTLGQLLELPRQGNGDAARKAVILAAAIKPDTLPET
jgi:hypothetical protein